VHHDSAEPTGRYPSNIARENSVTFLLLILFVAALVQAVTGFGFALVAVPLLTLVIGPQDAVICASTASLAMTLRLCWTNRSLVDWPITRRLLGWTLLGMPFGLLLLRTLADSALAVIIAVVVLGCCLLVWRRWTIPAVGLPAAVVGVVTGVLATATGTNGPPLVAAVHSTGVSPAVFRATMAALLSGCGVVGVGLWIGSGVVTATDWVRVAFGLPVCFAGAWIGRRLVARVDAVRFRQIVLSALVASSAVALAHAAW
jgi:uncharacterized protein